MKLVLEPRCLFDGSVAATADHAADAAQQTSAIPADAQGADAAHADTGSHDAAPPAVGQAAEASSAREIMFVDQRVAGWEQLVQDARPDVQVVVLDLHRDALTQISETLTGRQGIEAIHIVSHGSGGSLDMGNGVVTASALAANSDQVASWRDHLADGADIMLWGCDVGAGEAGQALLADLHSLTGADVAASTDATGATARGGDWVLERAVGGIEHDTPLTAAGIAGYDSLLAPPAISDTQPANQTREVVEDGTLGMARSVRLGQRHPDRDPDADRTRPCAGRRHLLARRHQRAELHRGRRHQRHRHDLFRHGSGH
ncbi:MAG: DUF4347 domain-containing protein [Magnetospirillum sp.]|nr:DUF4347 domain-containing protein [Magnetospirillum sp.]